jgi:hypothetical protein
VTFPQVRSSGDMTPLMVNPRLICGPHTEPHRDWDPWAHDYG